ncbi:MAG: hypothetical protein MUE77_09360 [Sandarakinorhabdus sp.]|nr:hypothetical protein [Sandarakinorhabdus sp.]
MRCNRASGQKYADLVNCRINGNFIAVMSFVRALPGFVLALVLAGMGIAMMLMAWAGWAMGVNWYWALGALVLSLGARFNGFLVVGVYFFAHEYMHWDIVQSLAFATMGLMYLTPGIMRDIALMLTGNDVTGRSA